MERGNRGIGWQRALEGIVLVALGLFLYGDSVRLPFFFDDIIHKWWIEGNSFWNLWKGTPALGYYRPLPSAVWKASLWLTGVFNAPLLHALNVALHILSGLLVAALTRRLARREPIGLVAGLLFLAFPFSYQAVPWVGAIYHPMATCLILGALLSGMGAQRWPRRALSLALTAAACFTHETGVIVGGWLLGYELLYGERRPRRFLWPLTHLALGAAYALLYFSLPRADSPLPPLTAERLTQNGAYLLQGLAFPIAPLFRWTMVAWGWNDLRAAQAAALVSVGVLTLLCWRGRGLRLLAFALLCFASAAVPSWLLLYYNYVISGPRLLYLASVGAALAWACGIGTLAGMGASARRRILAAALTGVMLAFGWSFVRARQHVHRIGGDLIWQVTAAARAAPADEPMLIVNYPAWLAPDPPAYPIGHEGVEFMPGYTYVSDLVWVNGGPRRDIQTAKFHNTLVSLPGLTYGVRGPEVEWEGLAEKMRAAGKVYAVHYAPRALRLAEVGRFTSPPASSAPPLAIFDGRVTLAAAEITPADGTIALRLLWQAHGPLTDTVYSVFVHLYDASGALAAQADGYVLDGMYPFWMWRAGEQIEELRRLAPESGALPADYQIGVGIYDVGSGRRLPAMSPDGERFENDVTPLAK